MDQRISFITLVVGDVAASREFYVDRLGWKEDVYVPGEVLMIRTGERLMLSLWQRSAAEAELGAIMTGSGVPPVTLAHNLADTAQVDAVLSEATAAGADPVQPAVRRDWGGYSGYFGDPDGYRWEVAYNPGPASEFLVP
ncbi:MAG: VOC family protein [Microlunatus sp.]|nr:VOC family protein [Microlunatus sp.]